MGLFKHLLLWPVTGPLFLTEFALSKVSDVTRQELTDDEPIKIELLELQLKLDMGELTEEEYVRREGELMVRLREVRAWREEFGLATAGGLVQVRRGGEEGEDGG